MGFAEVRILSPEFRDTRKGRSAGRSAGDSDMTDADATVEQLRTLCDRMEPDLGRLCSLLAQLVRKHCNCMACRAIQIQCATISDLQTDIAQAIDSATQPEIHAQHILIDLDRSAAE